MKPRFLLAILLCWPFVSMADVDINKVTEDIVHANDGDQEYSFQIDNANRGLDTAKNKLTDKGSDFEKISDNKKAEVEKQIKERSDAAKNPQCDPTQTDPAAKAGKDERSEDDKAKALEDAKKKYEDAKATEQSLENRTLTALSTAATGIGGMELARGLAEQSADKAADQSMAAYIATMRCTYGEGKQVKAGPDEIELPGGNSQELMNLRAEYFALAADLKERKEALGMQPGIESEEILDKAATGLYDDENVGITSSAYASLYRAQMMGSEEDQAKIDDERKASKNRVIAGAVVGGVGVVGSMVGNSLINGKLGEYIKNNKNCTQLNKVRKSDYDDALEKLKKCLKDTKVVNDVDSLSLSLFPSSILDTSKVNCDNDLIQDSYKNKTAQELFTGIDSNDPEKASDIVSQLINVFGNINTAKMLGTTSRTAALNEKLKTSLQDVANRTEKAKEEDETNDCKIGSVIMDKIKDGISNIDTSQLLGNTNS